MQFKVSNNQLAQQKHHRSGVFYDFTPNFSMISLRTQKLTQLEDETFAGKRIIFLFLPRETKHNNQHEYRRQNTRSLRS